MAVIAGEEATSLKSRYPQVFHRPLHQKLLAPVAAVAVAAYLVFCVFFFNVAGVISDANWERAGTYIADWYSWEANPRFRFKNGQVELEWTRSLLGDNPDPDWITRGGDGSYTVTLGNPGNRVEITATHVVAVVNGRPYDVPITEGGAELPTDAPSNMSLKNGRVTVDYGFVGLAEIRNSQVFVRHRFLGWPNFFFDTKSPFFGMDMGQLWISATSAEQIDARMPNWQLMLVEFLYNSEWQHLDTFNKLLQTIVMAFVGTLFAATVAFPLSFLAAPQHHAEPDRQLFMKRFFDLLRSVDMLIWALFFVRGFGPGPIPGIAAIFFTDTGTLGKTNTEALENIDDKQREGVRSVGASAANVQRYGVVPQVLPVFISQALYFGEQYTLGHHHRRCRRRRHRPQLIEAMRTNQDWENVAYMVILILIVVFVFDNISNAIRSRLIGRPAH